MEEKLPWDFLIVFPRNILESCYDFIFSEKKFAITGINYIDFLPNILSFLPVELRLISFSSFVIEPSRQSRYGIIQLAGGSNISNLDEYEKFDVTNLIPFYKNDEDVMFERSIKFFVELLKTKNYESLKYIINEFTEIVGSPGNKLKIIVHYEQIRNTPDEKKAKRFSYDILQILDNFDDNTSIKYLNKIKQFLHKEDFEKYSLKLEIDFIIKKFSNDEINMANIIKMFHLLKYETIESRLQLLKQLVEKRQQEVLDNGGQILIDSRYSNYSNEIMQVFIGKRSLHSCIFSVLNDPNLPSIYKQGIYELLIQKDFIIRFLI